MTRPSTAGPRKQRVFVVVSRQVLIDSKFAAAVCAPVDSRYGGLRTQAAVGVDDGLKHESSIHCDELASLPKSTLTHFVGHPRKDKLEALDWALGVALDLELTVL